MLIAKRFNMSAGIVIPKTFNYLAIKLWRRGIYSILGNYAAGINGKTVEENTQISRLDFYCSDTSEIYDIKSHMSQIGLNGYMIFNGKEYQNTANDVLLNYGSSWNEYVGCMFDQQTTTKACISPSRIQSSNRQIYDIQEQTQYTQTTLINRVNSYYNVSTKSYDPPIPVAIILDVSQFPFDPSVYNRWCFYNGGDNSSAYNRTWVKGEILGSADKQNWFSFDRFEDSNMPNTNNTKVYDHALSIGPGDLKSDLDITKIVT